MKKIFQISAGALGIILFFLAVYNLAFKQKINDAAQVPDKSTAVKTQPGSSVSPAAIKPITQEAVFGTFVDKKNKQLLYYSKINGIVWQYDDDGKNPNQFSSAILKNIIAAQWSPNGKKVITNFNKDGKAVYYLYDYDKKAGTQLKDGIDTIIWDGIGTKIFYKYYDAASKKRSLDIANPDGSNWQVLVDNFAIRNVSIAQIPLSSMLSYWNSPTSKEETQLNIVGFTGGSQKTIFKGKFGADYLWSPDGQTALVSFLADDKSGKMTLGTIDSYGGNYKDLGVSTLVSKCAWSQDSRTVYCAVPGDLPSSAIMPDDYYMDKVSTVDMFKKINIQSAKNELIVQPQSLGGDYDATRLMLSSSEGNLFFVNKKDGRLYMITL